METGTFRGFEVVLHDPGIALVTFNQPDRLNGMTQGLKRDLVEVLTEAQMDDGVRVVVFDRLRQGVLRRRRHLRPAASAATAQSSSSRTSAAATATRSARTPPSARSLSA